MSVAFVAKEDPGKVKPTTTTAQTKEDAGFSYTDCEH